MKLINNVAYSSLKSISKDTINLIIKRGKMI